MSLSPQKQSSEDVSPGVRTPTDRSPEASIATPLHGERAGAKKRPRLSGDEDAGAELTSGGARAASATVREIATEIRVDALKRQARTLSAELAGAILEARRSRYGEKMRREDVGRAAARGLSRLNRARIESWRLKWEQRTDKSSAKNREDSDAFYDANDRVRALIVEVEKLERCVDDYFELRRLNFD